MIQTPDVFFAGLLSHKMVAIAQAAEVETATGVRMSLQVRAAFVRGRADVQLGRG